MRKECKIKGLNPRKNPCEVRQKNQVSVGGETELGGTLLAGGNDDIVNEVDYAKGCKEENLPIETAHFPGCQSEKRLKFIEMLANEPDNGDMSGNEPKVSAIPSGETARAVYGYRYGAELLKFNRSHLDALLSGHQLAVEISQGEYVLFIEANQDMQDKPLWTEVKYWEGRIPPPEYFAEPSVHSTPNLPAIKIKDLCAYAKQTRRDLTELSREEIDQFLAERKHNERRRKNV